MGPTPPRAGAEPVSTTAAITTPVTEPEVTEPIAEVVPLPVPERPPVSPQPAASAYEPSTPSLPYGSSEPALARGRSRGWVRVVAISTAVALVVAALVVGVLNHLGTRDRLSSTRNDLTASRAQLARTTRALSSTKNDLTTRTAQFNSGRSQLAQANKELAEVTQSLADAESRVDLQAGQISTLRTCLSGIVEGLNRAANGDFDGALTALEAVDSACRDAEALL